MTDRSPGVSAFRQILQYLQNCGVTYCILHGHDDLDRALASDVDVVIDRRRTIDEVIACLDVGGWPVVQHLQHETTCHYLVIRIASADLTISLDISTDYRRNGKVFYSGPELLARRAWHDGLWVSSPAQEFGYTLVKRIAKGALAPRHQRRLEALYAADPDECAGHIERFWTGDAATRLKAAASGGGWEIVMRALPQLRAALLHSPALVASARYTAGDAVRRVLRVSHPTGLHVVFLGPDGAGKSSVIEQVETHLQSVFRRTERRHLRPRMLPQVVPAAPAVTTPHGFPPRSRLQSLAKLGLMLGQYVVGYVLDTRPSLVRSTLVLYDRYFHDLLVDPRRYRYNGPAALARFVAHLIPQPDLVILLDAPTVVLQSRKSEVSPEESERQRVAYLRLIDGFANGHVVDASRPLDTVVADVNHIILTHMTRRTRQRLGTAHV